MLKKLSFALLVFIAVLLSGLSLREYDQFQKEQDEAAVVTPAPTPDPVVAPTPTPLETDQLKVENDMLKTDCLVGLEAYNKLSAEEQAATPAPSCGVKVQP